VQIGGPTGAFIVIVVGIINEYGFNGMLISTILAGFMLVLFGVLKLGNLLKYIPHPMVVGFTSGIALIIFTTQVKDALGLTNLDMPSGFTEKWGVYFKSLNHVNTAALLIATGSVLITVYSKKIFNKIPGSLIAILLATFCVQFFQLPVATIESVFGAIPSGFHLSIPEFRLHELTMYIAPALTIAILGGIESLLSATVADGMISGNHRSNTELIAQGLANIVTPFFGGIPATGAIARTATNIKNGGRTPLAGIIHAGVLFLIMIFFGRWAKLIPMACLAGILITVAYNMSEWRSFISIFRSSGFDIIILLATFLLTVFYDLTVAVEVGIILSALLFMKRMADIGNSVPAEIDSDIIDKYEHIPKNIAVYEVSGPFFFASAKTYTEAIKNLGFQSRILIIRMRHVPFIDATGCKNFKAAITFLHKDGTMILLSGVNDRVAKELEKNGITEAIGIENVLSEFSTALLQAKEVLNT
jgi:sulfate permease, SulP family